MSKESKPINDYVFIIAAIMLRPVWPSMWWHQHLWLVCLWTAAWLSGSIGYLAYLRHYRKLQSRPRNR
jgi:hypothetical protein